MTSRQIQNFQGMLTADSVWPQETVKSKSYCQNIYFQLLRAIDHEVEGTVATPIDILSKTTGCDDYHDLLKLRREVATVLTPQTVRDVLSHNVNLNDVKNVRNIDFTPYKKSVYRSLNTAWKIKYKIAHYWSSGFILQGLTGVALGALGYRFYKRSALSPMKPRPDDPFPKF